MDGHLHMPRPLQNQEIATIAFRSFLQAPAAGGSLSALSAVTSQLPLNNFDIWEDVIRGALWADAKRVQHQDRVDRAPQRFPSWLDLCSSDGRDREKALRSGLGPAPDGFLFSLALRRLNDWVPQVRMAARECVPLVAASSEPEVVADALCSALPNFASWGRMGDGDRQVFLSLISAERIASSLKDRVIGTISGSSTKILIQAGRAPAFDRWLKEIATKAVQPSTRAKAYRSLMEGRVVWPVGRKWIWTELKWCKGRYETILEERQLHVDVPLLATLASAAADRSSLVRRLAAELLIKNIDSIGEEVRCLAEKLASDRSRYVSERGKFALARLCDPAAVS